eukprot:SAG11_NODE_3343_length_2511_cov_1.277778_2_plen_171_part_00
MACLDEREAALGGEAPCPGVYLASTEPYLVKLTATDEDGNSGFCYLTISVYDDEPELECPNVSTAPAGGSGDGESSGVTSIGLGSRRWEVERAPEAGGYALAEVAAETVMEGAEHSMSAEAAQTEGVLEEAEDTEVAEAMLAARALYEAVNGSVERAVALLFEVHNEQVL